VPAQCVAGQAGWRGWDGARRGGAGRGAISIGAEGRGVWRVGHDRERRAERSSRGEDRSHPHSVGSHTTLHPASASVRAVCDRWRVQDRTGQDRTGQDRTGQDRTGQDRTRAVRSVTDPVDVSGQPQSAAAAGGVGTGAERRAGGGPTKGEEVSYPPRESRLSVRPLARRRLGRQTRSTESLSNRRVPVGDCPPRHPPTSTAHASAVASAAHASTAVSVSAVSASHPSAIPTDRR
jgi:hypothetical protein